MQKIVPCIWANGTAEEMAELYGRAFDAKILNESRYPDEPLEFQKDLAGKILTLDLDLQGFTLNIVNADGTFRPNPSISFMVSFDPAQHSDAKEALTKAHQQLMEDGGRELMELGSYPFSDYYAWVEDRFGVSWQLMLTSPQAQDRPFIMPAIMFTRRDATAEFTSMLFDLFPGSQPGNIMLSPKNQEQVMYSDALVSDTWMMISDGGQVHDFTFTPGLSLIVYVSDQAELDRLWEQLSEVPEAEQCGWCQDKFGLSWQVVPENLGELMQKPDAYQKLMAMKKIEISQF